MLNSLQNKKIVKDFYYKTADKLDLRRKTWERYGDSNKTLEEWIIEQLPELKIGRQTLIDIGCGTGDFLFLIEKLFKNLTIYGTDISEAMIESTRSKLPLTKQANILLSSIDDIPLKDNQVDIATVNFVLHHIFHIDKSLQEVRRVMKKGGIVFITTYDPHINEGFNKLHYQSIKKLSFPKKMLNTTAYTRFSLNKATKYIKKVFQSYEVRTFRNNLSFTTVDPALRYYKTAMMFRNSQGYTDPDIPKDNWRVLEACMRDEIDNEIIKNGKFVSPGNVVGWRITT